MSKCLISNKNAKKIMSFGKMPIANGFLSKDQFDDEYFFEMEVAFCDHCKMFQLVNQPEPQQMFNQNYAFFSGTSKLMGLHFEEFAIHVIKDYLNDTPDPFVTYWINKYESVSRLLISQLIVAEVEKNGISLTDKKEVQKESERLLQNADNTKLSKEGMRLMNAYAAGGFHEIRSQFATKPYTMHVFLRKYVEVVNQIVSERNTGD